MQIQIKKSKLSGDIVARPSKSFAHRYLIASALSDNESTISNVDFSEDITATLNCIHAYGKKHNRDFNKRLVSFSSETTKNFEPLFDCKESGTTLRMFMPIAMQKYDKTTFIGSERLIERGISIYEETLNHILFHKTQYSIETKGQLYASKFSMAGNVSSQYISGLLYALPLLNDDSEILINTELESKNYILMTLDVLKNYGIEIETNIFNQDATNVSFKIKGNQKFIANDFTIEGDYSNAAFIDAFNYFDSSINLKGLNPDSYQSDKVYKEYFDKLANGFCEIDISNCIDLGPILITFAALKDGAKFIGTKRLKIKESDRGTVIANELRKCGADIDIFDNEIIVNKKDLTQVSENFDSHNDHRIAMSLSLLSTQFDICIEDAECVKKSYPDYFEDLKKLGATVL